MRQSSRRPTDIRRQARDIRVFIRRSIHARILRLSRANCTTFDVTLHALLIDALRSAGDTFDDIDTSPESVADALKYLQSPTSEPFEV